MAACVSDCKRSERGAVFGYLRGGPAGSGGSATRLRKGSALRGTVQISHGGAALEFSMSLTTTPNSTLIGLSMQATFGFIPAFPSARSFVLALLYLVSAMRATDARIAAVVKRVIG